MYSNFNYDRRHCGCPCCEEECTECTTIGCHYADITVPVELTPTVIVGTVQTECCDGTLVTCNDCGPGRCEFIITQKVKIKIPVTYAVCAEAEDSSICCIPPNCCR